MTSLFDLPRKVLRRTKQVVNQNRLKRFCQNHRQNHLSEYAKLDIIIKRFRHSGGFKYDLQGYKLFSLSHLLQQEKPKSIIEFGTGITTAVFADYVRETDGASLTSVDESEQWLDNSKKLAGISDDDTRFEFLSAERKVNLRTDPISIKYGFNSDRHFDFVFIDGPSMTVDGIKRKDAINSDIFGILEKTPLPNTVVISIRKATVEEFINRAENLYEAQVSDILTGNIKDDFCYLSIFKLKQS